MLSILIYFCVGFLIDMLSTLDVQAVQNNQAYRSASISFIATVLNYLIFYNIIIGPDFLMGLLSYALGGSVGTVLTIRRESLKSVFSKRFSEKYSLQEIKIVTKIPEEIESD